jgi:hypothetical protein
MLDSLEPIKAKFLTFFTDKVLNFICQYDFWAITIFTGLKLALKLVIFRSFCPKFWVFPRQIMIKVNKL